MRAALGLKPVGEGKEVKIDFCKTDIDSPEPYLQLTLSNTLVSHWGISSASDRPTEAITLSFTNVEFKNIGMGPANETGTSDPAEYNLATQTGS
jgi:type VI secretion system secreted protein Hcp